MAIRKEKKFEEINKLRDTLSERDTVVEKLIKDLKSKGGDNMDGEKRANDKLDIMMKAKLNKVEQRAYDNLKEADKLDMLSDDQKEQLKKLEEKRKQ
tara:strand:- start:242 stop:532 length:291 start_codon:yes stop_codon:yes gene_type:complete